MARAYHIGGLRRALIWQSMSGTICDMSQHDIAGYEFRPEADTQVMDNGTTRVRSRRWNLRLRVSNAQVQSILRLMEGPCGVHGALIGYDRVLVVASESGIRSSQDYARLRRINADVFDIVNTARAPAIYAGGDLLEGIPWAATDAVDNGGTFVLQRSMTGGYTGPWWEVESAGDSVDLRGILSGNSATLTLEMPLHTATLRLDTVPSGGVAGSIEALDWDGGVLASASEQTNFTVPTRTWQLRITVTSNVLPPALLVISPGEARGVRPGEPTDCTTRATAPAWTQTGLDLTGEDVDI